MIVKKRKAKRSDRGIYLQDLQLKETKFQTGTKYKYIIDTENKRVLIVPSESGGNTVSKRSIKDGIKPVIDIRDKVVREAFSGSDFLEIEIFDDQVVITGHREEGIEENLSIAIDKTDLDTPNLTKGTLNGPLSDIKKALKDLQIPLQIASLFSGAGVLDKGFLDEGFDIVFALEKDEEAVETYKHNLGDHIICEDITKFDFKKLAETKAPIIIGGSPCQGFSSSNRHTNYLSNPNNLLVNYFIKAIKANPHCKIFVLENVPQILTAGNGQFKEEICNELSDFEISTGIINATQVGGAQRRSRAVFIGSKIGKVDIFKPSSVKALKTVRDAFFGLHNGIPNQTDYTKPRKSTIDKMKYIPPGGNWRSLPSYLKTRGMLSGKTHSSIYKRLAWGEPSITITNVRKSLITHPSENRTLTIRECARLLGLEDEFIFKGSLNAMQQQVANAVPIEITRNIAKTIKDAILNFNEWFANPQDITVI